MFVEHGLSEWYSPVQPNTGLHPRPANAADLQRYFPTIDPSWSSLYYPSQKGETVSEVHNRTTAFVGALIPQIEQRYPEEQHRRVLLVSHAATVITLCRTFSGEGDLPVRIGCCSLTDVRRRNASESGLGPAEWEIVRLGEGGFMKEGLQREWGFEDIEIDHGEVGAVLRNDSALTHELSHRS